MRKIITIPTWVIICFIVGLTASYFQSEALSQWYPLLNRSSLTPPNIVFPIVWSILYLLMGISSGLVTGTDYTDRRFIITIFIIQLILNFMWSMLFFYMHNPLWGLIDIIVLDLLVLLYIIITYRNHRTASYLFIPYMVWLIMATYLNGYIYLHN